MLSKSTSAGNSAILTALIPDAVRVAVSWKPPCTTHPVLLDVSSRYDITSWCPCLAAAILRGEAEHYFLPWHIRTKSDEAYRGGNLDSLLQIMSAMLGPRCSRSASHNDLRANVYSQWRHARGHRRTIVHTDTAGSGGLQGFDVTLCCCVDDIVNTDAMLWLLCCNCLLVVAHCSRLPIYQRELRWRPFILDSDFFNYAARNSSVSRF